MGEGEREIQAYNYGLKKAWMLQFQHRDTVSGIVIVQFGDRN